MICLNISCREASVEEDYNFNNSVIIRVGLFKCQAGFSAARIFSLLHLLSCISWVFKS